jgi:histone H3/H4
MKKHQATLVKRQSHSASVFAAAVEQHVIALIVSGSALRAHCNKRKRVASQDVVDFVRRDKNLSSVFANVSILTTD